MDVTILKKPYEVSFTGNPMPFVFAISPYSDTERSQDIRLQVRILIEKVFGSGIYTEVRNQNYFPDNDGMVSIDVSTIVDPYLSFYTPKLSLQKPVQALDQRKRYKVSYLLQKDNSLVGSVTESSFCYAVKGGMAYEQWHPTEFFQSVILQENKPLLFDADKLTGRDELRFMYWVYPFSDNGTQSITYTITLDDGTLVNYTHVSTIFVGKWGICCIPVGFTQAGLAALVPAGKWAVKYSVKVLRAGGTQIVAPYTFNIDYRNFYNTFQLIYRNSTGGLETIRLRGQVDFEADYAREQAQRTVPPSYFRNLTLLAQTVSAGSDETVKFTGDTGFLSKESVMKLRDIFLSNEVFEVNGTKLWPVIINAKNTKFFSNKDNLVSCIISWQRAFTNEFFTPGTLMPQARSCPAVETLVVKQLNKSTLQILYALPAPYEKIEVQVIIGATTYTYNYAGNTGSIKQPFANPATTTPVAITIKGRTVCDDETDPADTGAFTTVGISVIGNSLPVASDDNYTINSGYNSAVTLPGSVLTNDYDPDGDAIEAVAASGATDQGGTYTINAAGSVTYTPPSSIFNGNDYFDYQMREVGSSTNVTARVNITVGGAAQGIFIKMVARNYTGDYAEYWLDFFSNPAGTQVLDLTGQGIVVNYRHVEKHKPYGGSESVTVDETLTANATGTKVKVYEGIIYETSYDPGLNDDQYTVQEYSVVAGTGYTAI